MIIYRNLGTEELEAFWSFLNLLDVETNAMMYEPGERERRAGFQQLLDDVEHHVFHGNDFLRIAEEDGEIVGYIRAERGKLNRISHTAYVVVGIRKNYRGIGIGTAFFHQLDQWAEENRVLRLELTVECPNKAAQRLYEKNGFKIEGIRTKSMLVDGTYVDEYYMAKIR